jgi:hypothetical protein
MTPESEKLHLLTDKSARSDDRPPVVSAKRVASLWVKVAKGSEVLGPNDAMCVNTLCTGHVVLYLGIGGLELNMPFMRRETNG